MDRVHPQAARAHRRDQGQDRVAAGHRRLRRGMGPGGREPVMAVGDDRPGAGERCLERGEQVGVGHPPELVRAPRRRRSPPAWSRPRRPRRSARRSRGRRRAPARSARGRWRWRRAGRDDLRPRPGRCPRAGGRRPSPWPGSPPRRASPQSPAPRRAVSSRRATGPAGRLAPGRPRRSSAVSVSAACSAERRTGSAPAAAGSRRGRMRRTMLCGSASGQSVTARGGHQVVRWRTHPGEMSRVPLPVGQRPEGPDLESRRGGGRRGRRR